MPTSARADPARLRVREVRRRSRAGAATALRSRGDTLVLAGRSDDPDRPVGIVPVAPTCRARRVVHDAASLGQRVVLLPERERAAAVRDDRLHAARDVGLECLDRFWVAPSFRGERRVELVRLEHERMAGRARGEVATDACRARSRSPAGRPTSAAPPRGTRARRWWNASTAQREDPVPRWLEPERGEGIAVPAAIGEHRDGEPARGERVRGVRHLDRLRPERRESRPVEDEDAGHGRVSTWSVRSGPCVLATNAWHFAGSVGSSSMRRIAGAS